MEQEPRPKLELVVKTVFWPVARAEVWLGDVQMDRVHAVGFSNAVGKGLEALLDIKGQLNRLEIPHE